MDDQGHVWMMTIADPTCCNLDLVSPPPLHLGTVQLLDRPLQPQADAQVVREGTAAKGAAGGCRPHPAGVVGVPAASRPRVEAMEAHVVATVCARERAEKGQQKQEGGHLRDEIE